MSSDVTSSQDEPPLWPDLPIIDCHHHILAHAATATAPARRYLFPDLLNDIETSGQNIVATVFVQDYSLYKTDGPEELRSLGETEVANGIAAMSASGAFGPCRVNAGIVAFVDLTLGDRAEPVLQAHKAAAGGRLRSIRCSTAYDPFPMFGRPMDPSRKGVMKSSTFRDGVALLAGMGLVYDVFCFHPQLDDLADLARAFPGQTIVLNHIGAPLAVGPYAERRGEVMADWKAKMAAMAALPNVQVKIGGLGMAMFGLPSAGLTPRSHSSVLAEEWRPYVQTCIDLFGTDRCMFESNYPPDRETASYGALWNTFKRLSEGYSADERTALFSGTANRTYSLGMEV